MLSFVLGPSGYGKTYTVVSEINRILDLKENRKIFVIVPEQESVKTEAELLETCGNRINADVEVINFSRLANRVFREAGGMTYKYIDNAGKDIMTAVILERMKSVCPTFADAVDDTKYLQVMRGEMDTLRRRGFHADDILKAEQILANQDKSGDALSKKLTDFATVFSAYEKSLKDNATDTVDDIARLAETLDDFDFFEDSYVFIDGFYDYTAPQYDVIEKIMKSCYKMMITLSLSRPDNEDIFRRTTEAFDTLRQRAEKNSVEYICIDLEENHRTQNDALKVLSKAVMTGEEIYHDSSSGVTVTAVKTPYDECVFVAREIVKLAKEGVPFSEIAVCASSISSYGANIENVFESYGIAHLNCAENSVIRMPIISLVLSALDVINSGFYSQTVRFYLKSAYLGLDEEEAYLLENYIALWNINRKSWYSDEDWTMHPRGYVEYMTAADKEELEVVNRARRKVFPPLKKLAEGFSERSTVKKKAESLVIYFDDLELARHVEDVNKDFADTFGMVDYDDEISAWNLLISALDILVEGAGDLSVGKERFIKYMRLILSDMSFGKIPSSLDEVELGDVEFVRNKNIKHLFFIGFNEGVFPAISETKSVFTESERRWLYDNGIKLEDSNEDKLRDQTFQFLLALLRPSQTLHFVYHTASSDSANAHSLPSYFYSTVKDVLGTEISTPDFSTPLVERELKEYLVANDDDLSLKFTGEAEKLYKDAMVLKAFADSANTTFHIENANEFIPKEYSLTQSRLERYQKCRFSYFVEYMLKARTRRKAEFGRAEIGSYVHKILEDVLKTLTADGVDITEATDEKIIEITRRSASDYISATASNINDNSPKYKYLVDNICTFVLLIITNIKDEFSASLFKPRYFEENIRNSDAVKPYVIDLKDGGKLLLHGVIDRVDTYTDANGIEYIRVVDYKTKTGGKSFSLEDVLNGLNLQMLIYLYAFTCSKGDKPRVEAGIMYMPASKPEAKPTDVDEGDDARRIAINKNLKRSGMYLYDKSIIDAMEKGENKRFVDVEYDKEKDDYTATKNSTLATLEEFGIIRRYIDTLLAEIVDSIKAGNIEANPIEEENKGGSACSYCPYHPICRYEGTPRERISCDNPIEMMKEKIK